MKKINLALFVFALAQGVYSVEFNSPNGVVESCLSASDSGKSFGIEYSKKDLKNEKSLCKLDFHKEDANEKGEFTAVCPKLVNSSPALEFFEVDAEISRGDFVAQECSKVEKLGSKKAKYKVSTSCSYTPSILAYYHFSRILNIGLVPVAVSRTLDRAVHSEYAKQGMDNTQGRSGWLPKNWKSLYEELAAGYSNIVMASKDQSYGALVDNPKGEDLYSAMYGSGVDGYKKHALNKLARSRGGIERQFSKVMGNLPKLFALKDYTDMLVIDAILSQYDRYGNANSYDFLYWWENGELKSEKFKAGKEEDEALRIEKGAIIAKRLLLKDNDCGINFKNRTLDDKVLHKIRHLSRETFENVEKLKLLFDNPNFINWLKTELLFKDRDVQKVKGNLYAVYSLLKEEVSEGDILLDLNPEDFK